MRRGAGEVCRGHHNVNHVLPTGVLLACLVGALPFTRCKYRVPVAAVEVAPRAWPREGDVLRVVARHLPEVPRFLCDLGERSLHVYRPGRALSEENPEGAVGEELMRSFADFFVRTAAVPVAELPPLPPDWPADRDGDGFLRRLAGFTDRRVDRANRERFGPLFDALGIPEGVMLSFVRRHTGLTPRPFALLHTDVHRANVVLHGGRLTVIDWELAMYGDPLHDLATHLVRMGYGKEEQARMTRIWTQAMHAAGHGDRTAGIDDDLPVYLAFEYAQSVFPDVMRAALGLPDAPREADFLAAARRVQVATGLARQPLRLIDVPGLQRTAEALRAWHATDTARRRAPS
ncbi:aminoglycoside phosphotransferase family protein [Streptomyces sp. NPDC085946]|uniref:aminoglycoside phosphotransferase family protein n=1 Tax=Streptomyces sp. NPDC085946 TaxID=3365744 RepID=UPI0037CF76ED